VTTETGSHLLIRGGKVVGGAGGKLNGKASTSKRTIAENDLNKALSKVVVDTPKIEVKKGFTAKPARRAKDSFSVATEANDKLTAGQMDSLAMVVSGYKNTRNEGHIMTKSQLKLFETLADVGAKASHIMGTISIGDKKDMNTREARSHLKKLGLLDSIDDDYYDDDHEPDTSGIVGWFDNSEVA
jgi:hypothetical protein